MVRIRLRTGMITDASYSKFSGRELNLLELRFQVATDFFQMFRACRFHFNLTVTVLRVDVIEYLFAALTCIVFHFTVQIFIDMYEVCLFGSASVVSRKGRQSYNCTSCGRLPLLALKY